MTKVSNALHTEFGVCYVPMEHQRWEEPLPTAKSWKAAHDLGITHVRLDYAPLSRLSLFEEAFRAARDGGTHVTPNMGIAARASADEWTDLDAIEPKVIEEAAYDLVMHYGGEIESVSFENEPGGKRGMSPQAERLDVSQGGTFDWIKEVYAPRFLAFVAGARKAKPGIIIDAFDADSTDVQERCMELVIGDNGPYRWCVHNYADIEAIISKGGQDYSSMAGMNGKPGFLSLFEDPRFMTTVEVPPPPPGSGSPSGGFTNIRRPRGWYISENGKSTGPFGGIATDSDMDIMIAFSRMMLTTYPQCGKIDWGNPKFFFTRVPAPPGVPPGTWCTWTFGEPVASAKGRELAGLFAPDPIKTTMPVKRRRAVRS